jgi:hypothetical protein
MEIDMPEFIANVWLYRTSDQINFTKESLERFVSLDQQFPDENTAKTALIQKAIVNDGGCNVVFDASWFISGGIFVMKGKSVRARFA